MPTENPKDRGKMPSSETAPPTEAEKQHTEDTLDEALDESFPASDPPSISPER